MTSFSYIDEKLFLPFNKKPKKIKDFDKLYCFVYMTVNLVNGKIYIGVHTTNCVNDSYLGSGKLLNKAIKKYGRENFKREILKFTLTKKEAYAIEKQIVNSTFIKESTNYNMKEGGYGGGALLTEDSRIRMAAAQRKRYENYSAEKKFATMSHMGKKSNWPEDKKNAWKKNLSNALKDNEKVKVANKIKYSSLSEDAKIKRNKSLSKSKIEAYSKLSKEDRAKFTVAATKASLKRIKCENCGKFSNTGNYHRWHGKNCRIKL